jgi:hypothetical protein
MKLRNITSASSFLLLLLVVVQMEVSGADEYHRVPLHTARSKNQQNRAEKEGKVEPTRIIFVSISKLFSIFAITTDAAYWKGTAQALLQEELNKKPIDAQAKNIIFFLGDGSFIFKIPLQ